MDIASAVVRVQTSFVARAEGLAELHAAFDRFFAEAAAAGVGVEPSDGIALLTAAGEIAANIVKHACRAAPDAMVSLALVRCRHWIEARFADPGVPYVPAGGGPRWEALPESGMGLWVARASLTALDYVRDQAGNHWVLRRSTP